MGITLRSPSEVGAAEGVVDATPNAAEGVVDATPNAAEARDSSDARDEAVVVVEKLGPTPAAPKRKPAPARAVVYNARQ